MIRLWRRARRIGGRGQPDLVLTIALQLEHYSLPAPGIFHALRDIIGSILRFGPGFSRRFDPGLGPVAARHRFALLHVHLGTPDFAFSTGNLAYGCRRDAVQGFLVKGLTTDIGHCAIAREEFHDPSIIGFQADGGAMIAATADAPAKPDTVTETILFGAKKEA